MFRALVLEKPEGGSASASLRDLDDSALPPGEVTVAVEYSTLNYKDGLCLSPTGGGLVRAWPHIAGIDFAGTVLDSTDPRYKPGDKVVLTGWRVGEVHWGGYAQKARVKADWLVPLPAGLTTRQAMAVGTAGLTSQLAIQALTDHGLTPARGEVLVTGAAGGVGSVAVALLAKAGYQVAAVTGRPETEAYLRHLGASRIIPRADLAETVKRPLESETWAGCIDSVGGSMLARVLGQMKYGASVAAVGLAGGNTLPASVLPFILRGVNLLGIDSVMQPFAARERAWAALARGLDLGLLDSMIQPATLADLPALGAAILKGEVKGRVVVDVNARAGGAKRSLGEDSETLFDATSATEGSALPRVGASYDWKGRFMVPPTPPNFLQTAVAEAPSQGEGGPCHWFLEPMAKPMAYPARLRA